MTAAATAMAMARTTTAKAWLQVRERPVGCGPTSSRSLGSREWEDASMHIGSLAATCVVVEQKVQDLVAFRHFHTGTEVYVNQGSLVNC